MGKNKNRLRAQRKFAQGAYIPTITPSTNGAAVPVMNVSHKTFNTPGPIIINHSSARDIFTKMTLGKTHSHIDWEVHLKYDGGAKSNLSDSNSKKKLKEKKNTKANFKKKYMLRNNQKSTTSNPRRVSVTTDSESDTPLSCLSIKNVGDDLQETGDPSSAEQVVVEKSSLSLSRNTQRSRFTLHEPDLSYLADTSSASGGSLHGDKSNKDKDYTVPGAVASDHTVAKTRKKLMKRKCKDKPKVPEVIKSKCPAPVDIIMIEDDTVPLSKCINKDKPEVPKVIKSKCAAPVDIIMIEDDTASLSECINKDKPKVPEVITSKCAAPVDIIVIEDDTAPLSEFIYKEKPKVPEVIKSKSPAPVDIIVIEDDTAPLSSNESSSTPPESTPPEASYDNTADWVRNHHQSINTQNTNANNDSGPSATTDSSQKATDPLATNNALPETATVNVSEGGDQFKVPELPVRFTKNSIEALEETPIRRLRSAKSSPIFGRIKALRLKNWGPLCTLKPETPPVALEPALNQAPSAAPPTSPAPVDASSNDASRMLLRLTRLEKQVHGHPSPSQTIDAPKESQNNSKSVAQAGKNVTSNAQDVEKASKRHKNKTTQLAKRMRVDGPSTSLAPTHNTITASSSVKRQNEALATPMAQSYVGGSTFVTGPNKRVEQDIEGLFDFPINYVKPRMATKLPPKTPSVSAEIISSETLLVFRPTPEEFKDPMAYIEKIQQKAKRYGICKIIPPKGFDVPSHLDDSVKFTTVSQYLGRLYHRWGPTSRELTFIQTYVTMLATVRERDQFNKAPVFEGVEVDLVKLYHVVLEQGGIENMFTDSDNWVAVAEKMGFRSKPDYKKLEKLYCKHVLPYESLSDHDRHKIQEMVDHVWAERAKSMMRRVQRPLHYQYRLLGEALSDDEEELPLDPETEEVKLAGKHCFDRIEECTGKGRPTNLANYRRVSDRIKEMRFANGPKPTTLDIEDEYWAIVTLGTEHTAVQSGFIDTSVKNLGHPTDRSEPGGSHPWNLKRLTENPDNILSSLGKTLSVTVPTLCLNQLFSTNCWHMDPHQLSWMDYMHEGPTKIWYAVSEKDSVKFRRAMQTLVPSVVQQKGIWLASDTTMVPPSQLVTHGVQLQRVEQNVGEYIVVFAGAYASSIATGLTISESIYFENKNFLSRIDTTFLQMRLDCEPAMFSNTMLLMRIASNPKVNSAVLPRVYTLLKGIIEDEVEARREANMYNCDIKLTPGRADAAHWPISWPYQEECAICRTPLILSKSIRFDEPRSLLCLKHALRIYSCAPARNRGPPPPVTLLYSMEELNEHMAELEARLRAIPLPAI